MKSFTLFLIILITPFTTMVNTDDYSIDTFKERMKKEGLFDIILLIKEAYGLDLAIISCEELNKNNCGNCKKLVVDYMPNGNPNIFGNNLARNLRDLFKPTKEKIISQIKLIIKNKIKNILKIKFTPKISELFADDIVKRIDISKFLSLIQKLS